MRWSGRYENLGNVSNLKCLESMNWKGKYYRLKGDQHSDN